MTLDAVIAALALPPDARVDQRVPKKLLLEQGAPTAADKRQIQDGLEEMQLGRRAEAQQHRRARVSGRAPRVPGDRRPDDALPRRRPRPLGSRTDPPRHSLSRGARDRQGDDLALSLAHKRWSQSEAGARSCWTESRCQLCCRTRHRVRPNRPTAALREPRDWLASRARDLLALYQGWIEWVAALQAARITGRFARASTPEAASARGTPSIGTTDCSARSPASSPGREGKAAQPPRRAESDNSAASKLNWPRLPITSDDDENT